jgi:uncharacterized membrane protein
MKEKLSSRLSLIGAGIGLTVFAIFGLLPGAFLGGVLGLNMASFIFGAPLVPTLIPRILVAIGMLVGVMVAGLMFTAAGASLGWLAGTLADSLVRARRREAAEEEQKSS